MILVTGGAGFIGANFVLHWLSESETRSLGTYPPWFDEYLLAKCRPAQEPSATSARSLTSRDKSACAMHLLQDHRKQQKGVPMAAPPAADLWRQVWRVLEDIGPGIVIRKCKGHATEADLASGRATLLNKNWQRARRPLRRVGSGNRGTRSSR